jgi:hypothetical protein
MLFARRPKAFPNAANSNRRSRGKYDDGSTQWNRGEKPDLQVAQREMIVEMYGLP